MPGNSAVWNRNVLVALFNFHAHIASSPQRNLALPLHFYGLVFLFNIIRAISVYFFPQMVNRRKIM
jgi:hypothetical protein